MLNDYNRYFSDTYKKRIFDMAEKGVFVLFETYPIFEDYLIDDVDTNIRNIFNFFKKDNYQKLYEFLDDILEGKHSENYLQAVKTQEFEDALFCLKNEKYSSCARTMIALIENDHENASNLNADLFKPKATKGIKRAEAITKQVNDLGCEFLSEGWKYLNSFYEKFYINTENRIDGFLNRHDIVHGHYEKALMPNDEWCLKLVFFYMSFKHISFLLQEIHDMYLELEKDLKVLFANKKSGK